MKKNKIKTRGVPTVEEILNSLNIDYSEDDKGRPLIPWCYFGNNFFDYGEVKPKKMDFTDCPPELKKLLDKKKIEYLSCEDCYGCAGW